MKEAYLNLIVFGLALIALVCLAKFVMVCLGLGIGALANGR